MQSSKAFKSFQKLLHFKHGLMWQLNHTTLI